MRIRKEEYTVLADFLLPTFIRDQAQIATHYPKLDIAFLNAFKDKLDFVKELESTIVVIEKRKKTTVSLYEIADELNNELTYLNSYVKDANLNSRTITELKRELFNRNIEGAILKTEAIKQYITEHKIALEAEGMPEETIDKLTNYKLEMETKNTSQNQFMNKMKELTEVNVRHYDELYQYMSNISKKGKLVFKDTIVQDEYTLKKNLSRMRAPKHKSLTETSSVKELD